MESQTNADNPSSNSKRSLRRSSNSHISMSDTESTTSQVDSWHSPLRSESPLRSDDPYFQLENDNPNNNNSKSLVAVDKYFSPGPSPAKSNLPANSPTAGIRGWRPWPKSEKPISENHDSMATPPETPPAPVPAPASFIVGKGGRRGDVGSLGRGQPEIGASRMVRDGPGTGVRKVVGSGGGGRLEEGYRSGDEATVRRHAEAATGAALGLRVLEVAVCLISFSVMAADRTQGWSGDSFDRYKEYRYCLAVNIIGFVYSAFQACDLACHLGAQRHLISRQLRHHIAFSMDQILAYLLMSASSSAATRVDDWITNWGKDEFTIMASASIAMSFLAFLAFALSALISGYNLCSRD